MNKKVRVTGKKKPTYLLATLDDVERADNGVSEPACKDTACHAFSVVAEVVDV